MKQTRREFVATSVAGVAGLCVPRGAAAASLPAAAAQLSPEDGAKLWLRFAPPGDAVMAAYRRAIRHIVVEGTTPTSQIIKNELSAALSSMLGSAVSGGTGTMQDGAIVAGTRGSSAAIRGLGWNAELTKPAPRATSSARRASAIDPVIAIASRRRDRGALRHVSLLAARCRPASRSSGWTSVERPRLQLRLLNHWDNLNGTIERGYAGQLVVAVARTAGHAQPAVHGLRARERVDRHQRGGHQQRQRQRAHSVTGVSGEGRRAGERLAAVRRAVYLSANSPRRCGWAAWPAPIRSIKASGGLVEGEGGRNLQADSRLRRLTRQGELRRAARTEGLRPQSRRGRQRARRRAVAARRHGHLARVHLRRGRGSRIARSERTSSS